MTWSFSIENVAGIRRGRATIEPGVNAVRASNWQGKSSFLASIETAMGTATPLTEGQSAGRVALSTDDDEFTVELERSNGAVTQHGQLFLDDEYDRVCAELFAFLGEDNEVRRAVRTGEDLEALLTRPLDFENIDERIADRKAERDRVESELERAERAADRLTDRQRRVERLEATLEEFREERAEVADDDPGNGPRDELSGLRAERDRVENRIERLEGTAERVRESLADARDELEGLSVPASDDVEDELETAHDELRDVERDRELVQSVYEANKRVLDEGRIELLTDVSHDVINDDVTCWLCGGDATRDGVEAQLSALHETIDDLRSEADELRKRVDELESKREEARTAKRRESDLRDRVADLESRLAETNADLETARESRDSLESQIDDLADAVDESEAKVTDLESEIKYAEAELADAREELEDTERRAEQRSTLEAEYDELTEEITELRSRKDTVKERTREAFSTALDDLLGRLDTGFETARLTGTFDLVVAREGREARLDALSEGERELLGIVAALAGHEAFDVGDRVPVMLLDGLGGLASDNLQILVDYLEGTAEYLVLTAYPEYERFDGHEVSPSDWQVVSNATDAEVTS